MNQLIEKLKKRWEIETIGQLILILFIFSITGMTALYVRKFAFGWLGIDEHTALWVEVIAWVGTVFPAYQVLFLFYGFVLGQFEFVWRFEKKSLQRITGMLKRSSGS
ncbi:prolipoprotein diacylglyceryl transferase [Aliifodinibius sp. S!AR15-10]|uniref:DUF6787 family protein n=1 Tax=Aliifodinibius sp. S!AR15-10 TaxID=2950437 RepID=UPI00285D26B1|nr:DUF6787 family protein [Aliifodinibius sp. S!AR15-10]MDR8392482.1 prolipoprotein diacylglyceryl transferase [Aliifodinibius sp. S!AR15-10]